MWFEVIGHLCQYCIRNKMKNKNTTSSEQIQNPTDKPSKQNPTDKPSKQNPTDKPSKQNQTDKPSKQNRYPFLHYIFQL